MEGIQNWEVSMKIPAIYMKSNRKPCLRVPTSTPNTLSFSPTSNKENLSSRPPKSSALSSPVLLRALGQRANKNSA